MVPSRIGRVRVYLGTTYNTRTHTKLAASSFTRKHRRTGSAAAARDNNIFRYWVACLCVCVSTRQSRFGRGTFFFLLVVASRTKIQTILYYYYYYCSEVKHSHYVMCIYIMYTYIRVYARHVVCFGDNLNFGNILYSTAALVDNPIPHSYGSL